MCSSPKGSTPCFRQTKRKAFDRLDYEEQASIMRRASMIYDRLEQQKLQKQPLTNNKASVSISDNKVSVTNKEKSTTGIFANIKSFLFQPIF